MAEIPFIKRVPAADAYQVPNWTRDKRDCITAAGDNPPLEYDARPKLVLRLCHKAFATYAIETITLRSVKDAQSVNGHSTDAADIIPAFEFVEKQAGLLDARPNDFLFVNGAAGGDGRAAHKGYTYLGKNLNPGTLALLANNCQPPSVVPGPLAADLPPAFGQPTTPKAGPAAIEPPSGSVHQPVRASSATGVRAVALSTEALVNVLPTGAVQADTNGQLSGVLTAFATFLSLGSAWR